MLNFSVSDTTMDYTVKKAELDCIITSKMFIKKANLTKRPEMIFLEDIAKKITRSSKIKFALLALFMPHRLLMRYISPLSSNDLSADAIILFSSGSSGSPKGVLLTHHNINSNVASLMYIMGWKPKTDGLLGNLPLFHSFGMTTSFWLPMVSGTKVIYLPNPLDSTAVGKLIAEYNLTVLLATPTFLQNYIKKCTPEQLSSLRFTIVGAEKMRKELSENYKKMTGKAVLEGFGCTELSPVVSINISKSFMELGIKDGKTGSAGHPIPNVCVKIVHIDTGEDLPPGEEGVMMIKGANVMKGYLNDSEKTSEVLQDGWYNSGDIAKIDSEGYIFITGRLSRFSKIAGEMVPHEGVEEAINNIIQSEERIIAVMGAPDAKKGEKLIVAHVELDKTPQEIIAELRKGATIPNLWIPRAENFVQLESMPLLGSSKLDLPGLKKIVNKIL